MRRLLPVMMTAEQRAVVEGVTILVMTVAIFVALWLLSGASHVHP